MTGRLQCKRSLITAAWQGIGKASVKRMSSRVHLSLRVTSIRLRWLS